MTEKLKGQEGNVIPFCEKAREKHRIRKIKEAVDKIDTGQGDEVLIEFTPEEDE